LQIPLRTFSTATAYVSDQEWSRTHLSCCPLHPNGGCSFRRHGSYARVTSPGVRIARWYCPEGRSTFSLMPDFLAVRLPGLLTAIENDVMQAALAPNLEAAADALRGLDIGLPSALRWLRRRISGVRRSIAAAKALAAQLTSTLLQHTKGDEAPILCRLRQALPLPVLANIPAPLGFKSA